MSTSRTAFVQVHRRAHQCVFVDDKTAYLAGAARAGIATIHYRDNTQLLTELGPGVSPTR